jgi:GAF domain-containing protein/HAMP domain-containing protein
MNIETDKPKRTLSLTTIQALAYFGVSVFVLLLSSGIQISLNVRAQQATLSSKQQFIAENAGKTLSNFIQDKFSSLETAVGFANPINATPKTQKNIMGSLLGIHPAFKQFALLDTQGRKLAQIARSSQTLSPQFADQLQGEMLTRAFSEKRYISPVYIDNTTSEPLIVIAIPVTNALGDAEGILLAEVNLKFMWDLVDQLKVGATGYAYVVDEKGTLIAYRDTALVLRNQNVKNIDEVSEFVRNPTLGTDITPGVETYFGLNGSTVVGTYAPVGTPKWAVVVELPRREANQSINTLVFQTLAIIFWVALFAGFIGSSGGRFSVKPISALANVANEVAKGNMNIQASLRGPTEIVNVATALNSMIRQLRDLIGNLERRVNERTLEIERRSNLLKAVADVGKAITSFRDLSELLQQAAYLIHENFGYYHVGIFLLDEHKEYAVLSATNSQGGQRMLEKNHQLKVGETGIVGYVTQNAKPRIALDVGMDAVYFDNPDLPQTRSEMALPLVIGGQVLGALDVQSTEPQAFSEEDISTLLILAEQIAVAIQNANLFDQAEKALETSRITYGELSREAWSKILHSQSRMGFLATAPATVQIQSENLEASLAKAVETGDLILGSDGLTISLPVKVRGQVIGAIRLKKSAISESWTQEETNLAIALSDQLSGALESARLYKESQQLAARESLISDISARISASSQTDAILRETVQELGQAIGNASVSFHLLEQLNGHDQVDIDFISTENGQDSQSETTDNAREAIE